MYDGSGGGSYRCIQGETEEYPMKTNQILGVVLLVVGLILLFFGWQASESLGEQVHETFTGRFTDSTMWYFIGVAAASVGGLVLILKR